MALYEVTVNIFISTAVTFNDIQLPFVFDFSCARRKYNQTSNYMRYTYNVRNSGQKYGFAKISTENKLSPIPCCFHVAVAMHVATIDIK